MKERVLDANFPRTADHRVYHLGLRAGEIANRIVTVGSESRARTIASFLDKTPEPFKLSSERGFITITGRYSGVPVSIVSVGMGSPNVDFFIREARECLSGDMVVIRLGSCGCLTDLPVGSIVIPKASVAVNRNYDFDFVTGKSQEYPYRISKPVSANFDLHLAVNIAISFLRQHVDTYTSFYSSQGRQTSFPDHNADLIEHLQSSINDLATLEMETFHIFHLATSWQGNFNSFKTVSPPLATSPVHPYISQPPSTQDPPPDLSSSVGEHATSKPRIKAAAAQMVFASRLSQDFITPEQVTELENWCARGMLGALRGFEIGLESLHPELGSVWEVK
ncbi:hypothetical protein PILCRDRAFT_96037 [Piloderma croceum F 1598]|uniref:Nucleoside phosphorylase domain-containing protein n=1 Tax=Piloderma croceum (strain F 1598) TaxID=765440 RepID=A0A0C3G766_PILCF|nr:hypothetical protein PILCRDRAFT_96037 [Piloderma croceum F 1598]